MNAQLLSHSNIARRRDPDTSHLAAAEITGSGKRATQQAFVRQVVHALPGLTSAEMTNITINGERINDRYVFARRLPELRAAGLVINGAVRHCGVTHKPAITWWPA